MSETMVERVAKAICEESGQVWDVSGQGYREHCTEFARAAIEAMREPVFDPESVSYHEGMTRADWWRAMVDAALATLPGEE